METVLTTIVNWVTTTGVKIVIALIILLVSFKIINFAAKKLSAKFTRGKYDRTLTKTFTYVGKIALKVLVVICLVGYLGIETSSISALLASLGVTAGLAINGTLSNLAGGVMLIITRPFGIGDYIMAQDYEGTVDEIKICYTTVITVDNKKVYLPNSSLSSGTIVNYSSKDLRRVDFDFSIGDNDPAEVKSLLRGLCESEEMILASPEPFIRISDYAAGNGTRLKLKAWCKNSDYWTVYHNILEGASSIFEKNNIVPPHSQLDVHLKSN